MAIRLKLAAGVMVTGTATERVIFPAVPVTVMTYEPGVAACELATVSIETDPDPDRGDFENEAVTPEGMPNADSVTAELNPAVNDPIEIFAAAALLPCWRELAIGVEVRTNPGLLVTTSPMGMPNVRLPARPATTK
jgi:hypothetical protein